MIKYVLFSVCLPNHYGPFCAKCKKKCQSCDSITGRCTQCPPSFHGEECQYNCPLHCLDLICNQGTGICNGCQNGYKGQRCEQEITTTVVSTGLNFAFEISTILQIHPLIGFPYLFICSI